MMMFFKYFIYLSFFLNILCGIWGGIGIFQWLGEMRKADK